MRVSLKALAGIDSVDVSLEKGLAAVRLKPGNTVTLRQLQEAIMKNGFTLKRSNATLVGTVLVNDGKAELRVSGSGDLLQLVPESQNVPDALPMQGQSVVVHGTIPEAPKGKAPDSLNYGSITEEVHK